MLTIYNLATVQTFGVIFFLWWLPLSGCIFFLPLVISAETGQLCLRASLGKTILFCTHTENSVGFILKIYVPYVSSLPDRSGTENQEKSQEEGTVGLLGQEGEELGEGTEVRRWLICKEAAARGTWEWFAKRQGQEKGLKKDRHENCKRPLWSKISSVREMCWKIT